MSSVPNTFVNGTVADANAVNANFQALVDWLNNNVASSGINTNISQITGLTTPPTGLGSNTFSGGVAGGSANALTITPTNPTGYTLLQYNRVWFLPSLANTNAATAAVNGTSAIAIKKMSGTGLTALVGGELNPTVIADMIFDGTEYVLLNPADVKLSAPQVTVLNSGSGTYTTPAGTRYLEIMMVGGGSGGGGAGTTNTGGASSAAGATTFGSLTANGGAAAPASSTAAPATAATASGGDLNIQGATGGAGNATLAADAAQAMAGAGAASYFGGGGAAGAGAYASPTNAVAPGSGGGGGVVNAVVAAYSGWGGNAGAFLTKLINSPAATYSYSVGAGTAGGAAGTSGTAGSAGAGGVIIVTAR